MIRVLREKRMELDKSILCRFNIQEFDEKYQYTDLGIFFFFAKIPEAYILIRRNQTQHIHLQVHYGLTKIKKRI
jgi:hypothetical protein